MLELSKNEFEKILPLTAKIDHNRALVFAVIENKHPGMVFVNKTENPDFALVVTRVNFLFVLGNVVFEEDKRLLARTLFQKILPRMQEKSMIIFSYSEPTLKNLEELFQKKRGVRIHRKQFKLVLKPGILEDYYKWIESITPGYKMEKLDNDLAADAKIEREIADFSKSSFGYCIRKEKEIISFCYSIFTGGGEAEIDIRTNEKYQGRGFAKIVAAAFILKCIKKELAPNWATWPYREGSIALAKKLGFEEREDIPAFFWAEEM